MSKSIPSQHTFDFTYRSDDGDAYRGSFTVKRPTIGMRSTFRMKAIQHCGGRYYDAGNPGNGVDLETWTIAVIIARLESCFSDFKATWFDVNGLWEFHDFGLLQSLWEEVVSLDDTIFRGRGKDTKEAGQEERGGPGVGRAVTQVVDSEVSAAVDI